MKKILIFAFAFFSFTGNTFSQDDEVEFEPELNKGDAVFSLHLGYPNWGRFNTTRDLDFDGIKGLSTSGLAPIGLSAEYFISKEFSLSVVGFFNSYGASWTKTETIYNGSQFEEVTYNYDYSLNRIRLLFGINYHFFDLEIDRFDFFAGLGVGINSIRVNQTTDDPLWDLVDNHNYFAVDSDNLNYPLALRANFGFRYVLKNNLVGGIDISAGGPTLALTLGYRL